MIGLTKKAALSWEFVGFSDRCISWIQMELNETERDCDFQTDSKFMHGYRDLLCMEKREFLVGCINAI